MEKLEIYEKSRVVPDEAKKTIGAGRLKGMTDINPMWRIKMLTELFGPCGIGWYIKPTNKWIETVGNEIAAFADIELYVKIEGEWSAPIYGTGGSKLATVEKNGVYVTDECYKMATTDAISVACKMLGIGADVYWGSERTKYNQTTTEQAGTNTKERNGKKPAKLTEEQAEIILREMERTGTTQGQISYVTRKKSLGELTADDYEKLIKLFDNTPDKVPPPSPDNPPDIPKTIEEELPWD